MSTKADRINAINAATDEVERAKRAVEAAINAQTAAVRAARTPNDARAYWHPEIVSWAEIGQATGISRQAAEKKWKHLNPAGVRADGW